MDQTLPTRIVSNCLDQIEELKAKVALLESKLTRYEVADSISAKKTEMHVDMGHYQTPIPSKIMTDKTVNTKVGTFCFSDGLPDTASCQLAWDNLDHQRAVDAFLNFIPACNMEGFISGIIGEFQGSSSNMEQNFLIWDNLMDCKSIFLTANTDTVYAFGAIDLKASGPVVIEVPPRCGPSTVNDAFFRFVTDMGGPGPDRGAGGKYLIVGPDFEGPLKTVKNGENVSLDGEEYFISHSPSYRNVVLCRGMLVDGDPSPASRSFRSGLKLYALRDQAAPPTMNFKDATGAYFNTVHANDFEFFNELNQVIQREPAACFNSELLGQLSAIGISKGKPFAPDTRMRSILESAVAVGNATARAISFRPRDQSVYLYPDSGWCTPFVGGDWQWLLDGGEGGRNMDARSFFFYVATANTPAMAMKMIGIGSQYAMIAMDNQSNFFDGACRYTLHLKAGIPARNFWSLVLYCPQTRSMLQTSELYPSINSQRSKLTFNDDGSVDLTFGPTQPSNNQGNWIRTVAGKGWFAIFRLYGPEEPWFEGLGKTDEEKLGWRPGSIIKVT